MKGALLLPDKLVLAIKATLRPLIIRSIQFVIARPALTRCIIPVVRANPVVFNRLKSFTAKRGLANPTFIARHDNDISPPSVRVTAVHNALKKGFSAKEHG